MKRMNASSFFLVLACVLSLSISAAKFKDSVVLEYFDFYESYGNQGVEIDEENMAIMFLHEEPELGVNSYKSFQVNIVEPEVEEQVVLDQRAFKHDVVEFHLIPEPHTKLTERLQDFVTYDSSQQKIDKEKAYELFRDVKVPHKYRHKVKGGGHIKIGNVRFTEDSKKISFKPDGVVTRIEVFSIKQMPDGSVVFGIETFIPEEPIDSKLIFDWDSYFPSFPNPEEKDDSAGQDSQEPQASVDNSANAFTIGYQTVSASRYYPWSDFNGMMQIDLSFNISRTDNPNNSTCDVSCDYAIQATFSRWLDLFMAEDFTADLELENEIYYQENEDSFERRLDRDSSSESVTGGVWGKSPPEPRNYQRRAVAVSTNTQADTEDP